MRYFYTTRIFTKGSAMGYETIALFDLAAIAAAFSFLSGLMAYALAR